MGRIRGLTRNRGGLPSALLAAALITMIVSCGPSRRQSSRAAVPLYLGLAYDVSGSVAKRELPVFTAQHLDHLLSILKARGGALAFGLIDEKAFEPLTRLELEQVAGRLDERAHINQSNEKAERNFKVAVRDRIGRPRNAKKTDIKGSIARLSLFFGEPTVPKETEKVAMFVSDGIDTGPWRKLRHIHLPQDVKAFVVGMERNLAQKLFGKQAFLFESIDAAIKALRRNPRS